MARIAVAVLFVALGLCTGCFVFDEIDQGREVMKKHSGHNRPGSPAAEEAEPEADEGPSLFARVQQFIQERREPGPPERDPDDEIVTCDLGDAVTFTYQSDCLARGGNPRS